MANGEVIRDSARKLIESGKLAHVVTLNRDGSPHVTVAWVGLDADEVVFATLHDQLKLKNLRRDPRVAISIETDNVNAWGLNEYLVIYGHAEITEGGAPELLQKLAYVYLGPEVKFPQIPDPPPGFVTRVTPERTSGIGPWIPSPFT
jgi:PPOX class probable F420-dependent enzyme